MVRPQPIYPNLDPPNPTPVRAHGRGLTRAGGQERGAPGKITHQGNLIRVAQHLRLCHFEVPALDQQDLQYHVTRPTRKGTRGGRHRVAPLSFSGPGVSWPAPRGQAPAPMFRPATTPAATAGARSQPWLRLAPPTRVPCWTLDSVALCTNGTRCNSVANIPLNSHTSLSQVAARRKPAIFAYNGLS